ncbi:MAG: tRNA adenosine(34) deaminase TadA [Acidimicrobiales bacterium]
MTLALAEAALALDHGDVPVGALVVMGGEVVGRAHNEREKRQDPCAHAEVLALQQAAAATGSWRLEGATVVVTLEPCVMCAGALLSARVGRLVFGAEDLKAGATGSLYNVLSDPRLNHEVSVTARVRAEECGALLSRFFEDRRA